jgi:hypothetical protein
VRLEPVADWTRLALEAAKQAALQLQAPHMDAPEDAIAGDFEPVEDTDFDEPHEPGEGDDEPEAESEAEEPIEITPETIRVKVAALVGNREGQAANEKQVGLAQGMLAACFNTDDDQRQEMRHRVLRWLFGVKSSHELQGQHYLAILDWLHPARNEAGKYEPSEQGAFEARMVEHAALLDEGQGELFADPLIQAALDMGGVIAEPPGA